MPVLLAKQFGRKATGAGPFGDIVAKQLTASEMAKKRWAGTTAASRKKALKKVRKARTAEGASRAAKSISPEAAKARALKAWETKRLKAKS